MRREILPRGNIFRLRRPSREVEAGRCGKTGARRIRHPARRFRISRRISASNTRWRNRACRGRGGVRWNIRRAASWWNVLLTSLRRRPGRIPWRSGLLIGGDRKIPDFDAAKEPPLDTARLKGVLQLAAEKAGWGKPLPKGTRPRDCGFYSFDSYTAAVAEVSVKNGSRETGAAGVRGGLRAAHQSGGHPGASRKRRDLRIVGGFV